MRAHTPAEQRRFERRAASGMLVKPMRGMYADAKEWKELSSSEQARRIVATLANCHEDWVFCLFSAAAVYGLEIGRESILPIHRWSEKHSGKNRSGTIVTHRGKGVTPKLVDDIAVTPPLQTVVDCLCALSFPRALAIADSAMRVLGLDKTSLMDELQSRGTCPGWRIARDAITYADPLSANGGESVARAVMIEQGFMIPQLQVEMHDPLEPTKVFYVDYFWNLGERGSVIGELDGKDKYVLPEMTASRDVLDVLRAERMRESRVSVKGAKVLRFTYRDVLNTERFCEMLCLYGVPRGAARPIGE